VSVLFSLTTPSRSLADFEGRLKDAEVGVVFCAGHGIQKQGANYIVPSNAQIEEEEDNLRCSTQQSPTCPCRCSRDQGAYFFGAFWGKPFNLERRLKRYEKFKQNRATALAEWQQLAA